MKQKALFTCEEFESYKKINDVSMICYAIMNLNSLFLKELLDDSIDYEDIGKDKFIKKLENRFIYHRTIGDTELLLDFDYCNSCNCNEPICRFIGNISKEHFGLYFDMENDQIKDIYHCNWYGNSPLF